MYHLKQLLVTVLTLAAVAGAAVAQTVQLPSFPTAPSRTYFSPAARMGEGIIRTWVTLDPAARPVALGATFSEAALSGLPAGRPHTEYALPFPRQAAGTPFTHFTADWNPRGHFPNEVYGVPHFDFHFYVITPAIRQAMTLVGENRTLALQTPHPDAVPPGYMTVPGAEEAYMGVHWVDAGAPELRGQPFTQTFIYGYYAGQLAFLEPMATVAYLRTRPNFVGTIKLPRSYPATGLYPTQYSLHYNRATREYTVALEGLTLRQGIVTPPPVTAARGPTPPTLP